jgi:hypothetical protein
MKKDAIFIILQIFPGQSDDFRDTRNERQNKAGKSRSKNKGCVTG